MKLKLSQFRIAILISLILSTITAIVTTIYSDWSVRYIYNIFYYTFFNFTLLSLNAIFFTKHRRFLNAKLRKFLRILFMILYSAIYLISTISYITTNQITKIQTILFLSQMTPPVITGIILIFIALGIILLAIAFYKKSPYTEAENNERNKIKLVFLISIILFIVTVLFNTYALRIENPLLSNPQELITYKQSDTILPSVFNKSVSFDKPNVVFILLESLSAERVGAYGYEKNTTPNIDNLAKKSIVFENAFSTASHSDYAQPGLLSSRYIFSNDIRRIMPYDNPRKFIWDIFKSDNYTTAYFSSQDDRWQNMNHYLNYENLDVASYSMTDGKYDYGLGLAQKDYDHKTANLALNWLNETTPKEKPFFLYLNFQATHQPRGYPKEFEYFKDPKNDSERYDNALHYVDEQIGRIIQFLKENGLENNTIITITSDHGEDLLNRHGYLNHGNSIYNEELHVPAIAYIPGIAPERVTERVSHIDFVPTLIQMLGYEIPAEFQGDIMRKNRPIFFVAQSHKYFVGMIQNDTKIILDMYKKEVEVYDLKNDPEELNNLGSKNYKSEILETLFWHYCQKDYYKNRRWENEDKNNRCMTANNFKI